MDKNNFTDAQHKDIAYWERNQFLLLLCRHFDSWIELHDSSDVNWPKDCMTIVCVNTPKGILTWHIKDDNKKYFEHLEFKEGSSWDGHSVEEKYERLKEINLN